jgi:PAS domain S-box-containing protein
MPELSINSLTQTILNVAPIGILIIDNDGKIVEFNPYLASVFGASNPEKFIGMKISSITGLKEIGLLDDINEVIESETPIANKAKYMSPFGKTAKLSYIVAPIKEKRVILGTVILIEDETRNK